MKIALLLFASLITFFSTFAQTEKMAFKNLTPDMGLLHGDVTCINQDKDGYLWFGTVNGLNKYNGIEFSVYSHNKNDSTSIPNNYINVIYVDKQNNVWVGGDGLCRYNRDKNNFERIPIIDNNNNLLHNIVTAICEDYQNQLWIGTNYGVFLFDSKNKRFIPYFVENDGKEIVNCSGICIDKNGILWSSFNDSKAGGLIKYDPEKKISTFYDTQHPVLKLKERLVNSLYIDNENNIWIGYGTKGIDVFNEKTKTIINYQNNPKNENSISSNIIFSIAQNSDGKILIGTSRGLNILDTKTDIFQHYFTSEFDRSLLSNTIQYIYTGYDGTLWIACWAGGVSIFDKRYDKFIHYKHIRQDVNSLSGNSVTCFVEDVNQNIWIATDGAGINYFNPIEKKIISYQSNNKNPQALTNNKVLALTLDIHGDLWAGMWDGGLNYFKINKSKLILKKKYPYVDENKPASTSVFNLYTDKNGQLWVGNFRTGAYFLDTNTYKFTSFPIIDSTNHPLSFVIIRDILCDYRNDMWFGTQGSGLIRYNTVSKTYEQFVQKEGDSSTIQGNSINVIFEDSKQRLWVGIDEGGLNLFDPKNKKFIHYTTDQGLPNNTIVGILEDSKGSLWISSFNGISKATIDSANGIPKLTFRNYTVQDGLQDKIFNRWSYFKSRNGVMYFGGLNGFNVFNPDSVKDNSYKPPVHITDFLLFNKHVVIGTKDSPLKKHISQTQELVLTYDQSVFTFRFVALNYIFSEKNQYAHIMEGFEADWNYVENKKEATYTNLDPGEYTFRVKASNNDGIWNEEGTSIKIIILPPWWQTIWFRIFSLLFIISLLIGIYLFKVNALKKQKVHLQNLVMERTKEIEEKNKILTKQALELNETNTILEEKNQFIEEQNELLLDQTEKLNETNTLLEERQQLIEEQAEELQTTADELLEKNNSLTTLNATKDRFFTIIAHDLKNPFNAILGFGELLTVNFSKYNDEKKIQLISTIFDSSKKIYKLLENLLQWARSQTGNIEFKPEIFSVSEVIDSNIVLVENLLKEKNLKIERPKTNNIPVYADRNMISTVIRNLLNNAIKFNENGTIIVECEHGNSFVTVKIRDTGIGINPDKMKDLFNIVSSKSTQGTRGETGTGLGLLLCKEFVDKNNGTIGAESEVGKGSTFYFTLPYKQS